MPPVFVITFTFTSCNCAKLYIYCLNLGYSCMLMCVKQSKHLSVYSDLRGKIDRFIYPGFVVSVTAVVCWYGYFSSLFSVMNGDFNWKKNEFATFKSQDCSYLFFEFCDHHIDIIIIKYHQNYLWDVWFWRIMDLRFISKTWLWRSKVISIMLGSFAHNRLCNGVVNALAFSR